MILVASQSIEDFHGILYMPFSQKSAFLAKNVRSAIEIKSLNRFIEVDVDGAGSVIQSPIV